MDGKGGKRKGKNMKSNQFLFSRRATATMFRGRVACTACRLWRFQMPRVRYTFARVCTCVFSMGARVAYLKQGARMEYKVLWKTGIKKKKKEKERKKEEGGVQHGCAREELIKQREGNVTWFGREEKGGWMCLSLVHGYNSVPTGCKPRPLSFQRDRERAYDFYSALFLGTHPLFLQPGHELSLNRNN